MKKQKTRTIAIVVMSIALTVLATSCSHDENLYRIQKDGLYGFINKSGKTIIEPQYDYVGYFTEEGVALIIVDACVTSIEHPGSINGHIVTDTALKVRYNYIDKKGKTILLSNEDIYLEKTEPWLL